jgi:predicted phage baseplate assembly protein
MSLPDVNLDDLRFQRDLVDEARKRIIRYCPEWTDYNLSDPGITLIELFAWMTELIVYRLNKVPEKNYVKFLDLLGVHLQPANSARVPLTFRLSAPFPLSPDDDTVAFVPQGLEIATQETPNAPQVVFTTDHALAIVPPRVTQLRNLEEFNKNYLDRAGIEVFKAFRFDPPQQGATFHIGFDPDFDLSGHILQLFFQCDSTEGVGVSRDDPPLVWECSLGDGLWEEVQPSRLDGERDTTGGLNNESGSIIFYLPRSLRADPVLGLNAFWLRCRFEQRRREQGLYTQSPRIRRVSAVALGATTLATHAVFREQEELGVSAGDPSQTMNLTFAPVLDLREGETLEVQELRDGELVFVPWQRVGDFSESTRFDRHFTLDTATGEIRLGPAVRQPDGSVRQYGRVPEVGRQIRISRYRYGGGAAGNVPVGRISILRSAVPYIDRVVNMEAASGGRDQETLEEAKLRARRELRAQERAVTAEDYENLTLKASRSVARVKCLTPMSTRGRLPAGMLELLIVPAAFEAVQAGNLVKLMLDPALVRTLHSSLDQYRLLTTTLQLRAPNYVGVSVNAKVVANTAIPGDVVVGRVVEALRLYLTPLPMSGSDQAQHALAALLGDDRDREAWQGWPFGKSLFVAEIYALIQQVRGVKHVLDVQISHRTVDPSREQPAYGQLEAFAASLVNPGAAANQLTLVNGPALTIAADSLLCSLEHEIELVLL